MISNPLTRADYVPSDHGLVTWAFDPAYVVATAITPVAGTLYTVKLKVPQPSLITAIIMTTSTAGATLTAGQNFAALYDAAGNQIGITADQATPWAAAAGNKDMPLTTPVQVNDSFCRVAFYSNGSTLPTWRTGTSSAIPGSVNLATAASRFGSANTGLTTAPPATLGTITAATAAWWVALR